MIIMSGNDAQRQALAWRARQRNPLWFSYDDPVPPPEALVEVPYNALAVFSEWTRYPNAKAKELLITDLHCFRRDTPSERHPVPEDLKPINLIGRTCDAVIFSSISRLYNQVLVEIGFRDEDTEKFGYPLAAEALTHLICNFRDSNKRICLVAHETFIANRIVPHLPKSLYAMASLYVKCDAGIMVVLKSALPGVHEGHEWNF